MADIEEYDEFLNFLEQYWFEYGMIPSKDRAVELGIDEKFYRTAFLNAEFRKQCLERGISLKGLEVLTDNSKAAWQNYMLTEEQLTVANVLLDMTDSRSAKKKLQDLGISTAQYQSWLRDPSFQNYIRARSENALNDNQHEAHLALIDRVRSGDMSAIKYFNEITGRYVPSSGEKNLDLAAILVMILDIIQRHVKDLSTQEVIAKEFLALAEPSRTIQGSVAALPASPEPIPEPEAHPAIEMFGGDL